MAADEEVEIDFDVNDKVSPKLNRMERAAGRLGRVVDGISARFVGFAAQAAGIGAFLGLGPAIAGAKRYIDHLDKISNLTGISAEKVGGISNALEESGASASAVDSVFTRLVKKGAQFAEGNKSLEKMAKRYGVALKAGPEGTILAVSKLMEKGKIGAGQLQRILGVSADDAASLVPALQQGPEALSKAIEAATKKNSAFNDGAMEGMQRFQNASTRVGIAWNRMTAGIMIKLAPALEKIATKLEGSIDKWAAGAERFGNYLSEHMDEILAKAKTFAKIMLATSVMNKFGISAGALASGAAKGVSKIGAGLSAGAQVFSMGASKGGLQVIGQMVGGLFKLRPIVQLLMKFGPIGIAVAGVVAMFKAFSNNIGGIGDRLKSLFGSIFDKVTRIGSKIAALFSGDGPLGKFMDFAGVLLLNAVERLGQALNAILWLVEKIIDLIPDLTGGVASKAMEAQEYYRNAERMARKQGLTGDKLEAVLAKHRAFAEKIASGKASVGVDKTTVGKAAPAVPAGAPKGPQVYQDFRGSRFDITQAFSDGYDPDRVAVAFSNDVAALGEKKVQSGFSPIYSVR